MQDLKQLVKQVSKLTGIKCRPASEDDLEILRDLEVPDAVVDFFANYAPDEPLEYGPSIRTIEEIELLCEGVAFEAGLIPFGEMSDGDTLCFDPEVIDDEGWPAIVRINHEKVSADATKKEVLAGTTPFCSNLPALLEMMLANAAKRRGAT